MHFLSHPPLLNLNSSKSPIVFILSFPFNLFSPNQLFSLPALVLKFNRTVHSVENGKFNSKATSTLHYFSPPHLACQSCNDHSNSRGQRPDILPNVLRVRKPLPTCRATTITIATTTGRWMPTAATAFFSSAACSYWPRMPSTSSFSLPRKLRLSIKWQWRWRWRWVESETPTVRSAYSCTSESNSAILPLLLLQSSSTIRLFSSEDAACCHPHQSCFPHHFPFLLLSNSFQVQVTMEQQFISLISHLAYLLLE